MPFVAQPTEKCTACNRTVYQTEKTVVDEKTEKRVYHKTCIRCSTCNKVLEVGQYSSMDGKFWCKPHFKQLFASKGNYDEGFGKEKSTKWENTTPVSPPSSFIPTEEKSQVNKEAKPTSEATAAKFRQFRAEGDSDRCVSCQKTVYLAERMLVEDKNDKRLFHKTCFKCSVCGMILDLRSYGSLEGKIYCKNHLKEQQQQKANAATGGYSAPPTSFIPATTEEKKSEKSQTPENIASKFRAVETDKCKSCGKSVYATERVTLPESFKQLAVYHKNCLKCSVCSCKLDVTNYGSANGVLFCTVHLKQFGKPEQAKGEGSYFVSPLASSDQKYVPGPREGEEQRIDDEDYGRNQEEREGSSNERERSNSFENEREQPERSNSFGNEGRSSPAIERSREESGSGRNSPAIEKSRFDENGSGRSSPALERKVDSGRNSPAIERERSESVDDESKKREEERQRKRDERQRQIEEEERKEEEERERRKKERERRIAESEEGSSTSTSSTSTGERDRESEREERRRKREEERKREDEERERKEQERKREREERRRQQDEEAKRELEEQERKAEERRKRLAELKEGSD